MLLPENVKIEVTGNKVKVTGEKGSLEWEYPHREVKIEIKDKNLAVNGSKKALTNTTEAHIKNMVNGVTKGYVKKLQTVYSHFPISIETKEKNLIIKNFLGEKQSRHAKIVGSTKVEVKGQDLTISGINIEHVGQTVANLIQATKILNRDSRVFQDGVYIVEE